MSRDHAEVEREFIDGLTEDTGRDLAAWMALIDARTFAHRNDMIDWLRQQNLTFAKASRLERIHHNGGRPLYGDRPSPKAAAETVVSPSSREPATPPVAPLPAPPPVASSIPEPPMARQAGPPSGTDLAAFLAKAKGYRPLAELLIRAIRTAVPATAITVHESHVDLAAPRLYGAMAVTQKDVRLALALADHPFEGDLKRLRLPGAAAELTHTLVISDARRVDAALSALVAKAAGLANS